MSTKYHSEYLNGLIRELTALPRETEWVEFKENRADPDEIGEYISALSNAATLANRRYGYLVWGVEDTSHRIVGTTFDPHKAKVGEEEIENWLLRHLSPQIEFRFYTVDSEGLCVVLLEIEHALYRPVQFKKQEYIRVGSYKKKLQDFPVKARKLWLGFETMAFEESIATEDIAGDEVLRLIDYPA